jgi:hypothetical protein
VSIRTRVLTAVVWNLLIAGPASVSVAAGGSSAPIKAPDFLFVPGADGIANLACAPAAAKELAPIITGLLESAGVDPQIVVVLATQPLICNDIYYVPLANDICGIGYQHETKGELFDETPDSRLEGIAFLNDFPYWQEHPAEFQKDFNHEISHRWGARLHASIAGADSTTLLGRDLQHWSYFLRNGGSPLEGNIWTEVGAGHYRADTPLGPGVFSDLDLYTMGVMPPSEVGKQEILLPLADSGATDCLGFTLTAASPPQSCGAYETDATPLTVGIDDVIAAEGERNPPAARTAKSVDMAVVVLESGSLPFDLQSCQAMTQAVPDRIADFATASAGRVTLVNLVTSGDDCASFTQPAGTGPATSGGCSMAPLGSSPHGPEALLLAALFVVSRRARRALR